MSERVFSNQSFLMISNTINYLYWAEQVITNRQDIANLAYYLGSIESTYITFDRYCENVASYKFKDNTVFMRVPNGNVIYIANPDTGKIAPLIMFTERHTVIENTIDICSIGTPIPTADILEVFYTEE